MRNKGILDSPNWCDAGWQIAYAIDRESYARLPVKESRDCNLLGKQNQRPIDLDQQFRMEGYKGYDDDEL
jgi:hypothetical protein